MLKKYLLDAGKNPPWMLRKPRVLKKHLLDAGKVPDAGKIPFQGWKKHQAYSKDSHWRQPLTSDSQAFVPEMTILHHPIGRATDIRTRQK